ELAVAPLLRAALLRIAMPDLVGIGQHAGSGHRVGTVQRDAHVKIAPFTIELAPYIRSRMPSAMVVRSHLRVPLRHAVGHALQVIAAAATDLQRDLSVELDV